MVTVCLGWSSADAENWIFLKIISVKNQKPLVMDSIGTALVF